MQEYEDLKVLVAEIETDIGDLTKELEGNFFSMANSLLAQGSLYSLATRWTMRLRERFWA